MPVKKGKTTGFTILCKNEVEARVVHDKVFEKLREADPDLTFAVCGMKPVGEFWASNFKVFMSEELLFKTEQTIQHEMDEENYATPTDS